MSQHMWWIAITAIAALLAFLIDRAHARHQDKDRLPRGTEVHYTRHITDRMAERRVSRAQIKSVLANPTRHTRDQEQNSVRLERDFKDRVLKVWVTEPWPTRGTIVVKTTAWQYQSTFTIPAGSRGRVIGRNGTNIRPIEEQTDTRIKVRDDGTVRIRGDDRASVKAARQQVLAIVDQNHHTAAPRWAG